MVTHVQPPGHVALLSVSYLVASVAVGEVFSSPYTPGHTALPPLLAFLLLPPPSTAMDASTLDNEWEEQDFETAEARREAAAALHDAAHLALLALSDGTSIPRTRASLLAVVAGDDPPGGDGDVVASSPPPPPPPPPALGGRRVLSLDEPLRVVLDGGWERRKGRGRRRSVRRRGKVVDGAGGEENEGGAHPTPGRDGTGGDEEGEAAAPDANDEEAWAAALDPLG